LQNDKDPAEEMKKAFALYDIDGTGKIGFKVALITLIYCEPLSL